MNYDELNDFVFYHSWVRYLDKKKDKEFAKEILWQIMRVGTGLDYDTDDEEIIDIVESFVSENIKAAQSRYNSARNGGKKKIPIDMARVHSMIDEGKTQAEIGKEFGVSYKTIQNRLREEKETNGKQENSTESSEEERKKKQDKDIDIDMNIESNNSTTYKTVFDF